MIANENLVRIDQTLVFFHQIVIEGLFPDAEQEKTTGSDSVTCAMPNAQNSSSGFALRIYPDPAMVRSQN